MLTIECDKNLFWLNEIKNLSASEREMKLQSQVAGYVGIALNCVFNFNLLPHRRLSNQTNEIRVEFEDWKITSNFLDLS